MSTQAYDLIVIGSGPAGQKGAIAAAKLGKRVAVVDRKAWIGGMCLHTGTIPSKTLREAILYLTGFQQRSFYGRDYSVKENISVTDLAFRVQTVLAREGEAIIVGGDVILDVQGIRISEVGAMEKVRATLEGLKPGARLAVGVLRAGQRLTLTTESGKS